MFTGGIDNLVPLTVRPSVTVVPAKLTPRAYGLL